MNDVFRLVSQSINRSLNPSPSPFGQWLSPIVREVSRHSLTLEYEARPEMLNPFRGVHGGVISAMFDETTGMTMAVRRGLVNFSTISLNVSYISKPSAPSNLFVTSKVIKEGKGLSFIDCEMKSDDQHVFARSNSILTVL